MVYFYVNGLINPIKSGLYKACHDMWVITLHYSLSIVARSNTHFLQYPHTNRPPAKFDANPKAQSKYKSSLLALDLLRLSVE